MAFQIESRPPRYNVFISHAGPDKHTIAIPLREKLLKHGIIAFVDKEDLQVGADAPLEMTRAMETAPVGVFVLSPEYPARKWPVKELQCFQRREQEANVRNVVKPILIPLFYRLTVGDCYGKFFYKTGDDGKSPFADPKTRFWEREKAGEPEANTQKLRSAMEGLTATTGVENSVQATNEESSDMRQKRDRLLDGLCEAVLEALKKVEDVGKPGCSKQEQGNCSELERDEYQAVFEVPMNGPHVSIDTKTTDSNDWHTTYEGRVKMLVLQRLEGQANVVGIHGTGGVGKTTTVKHIGNDNDVQRRFPDGILFIQLGQDAIIQDFMEEIIRVIDATGGEVLAGKLTKEKSLKGLMKCAVKWFRGKCILFIFDDLWEEDGLGNDVITEACSIVSAGKDGAIMFTTRNTEIAQQAPGRQVSIRPRQAMGEEARGMLFRAAGRPETDWDDDSTRRVIVKLLKICDGLPIALVVTGKGVGSLALILHENEKMVWKAYGENIERCIQYAIRRGHGSYVALVPNVRATLNTLGKLSVKRHGRRVSWEERFARLCVLEKQGWAPLVMIKRLWSMESLEATADALREMTDAGLAELDVRVSGECVVRGIRMHDLLNDVATALAKENGGVSRQHACLLNSYNVNAENKKCREWWSEKVEADGYIHENLARHLVSADLGWELVEVLMWPGWTKRQVEIGGARRLEEDFERGCLFLEKGGTRGNWSFSAASNLKAEDECVRISNSLRLIKEAIQLSTFFVMRNPREVYFQLQGRLVDIGKNDEMIECYLKRIEKCAEGLWVRPFHRCLEEPGSALRGIVSVGTTVHCMDRLRKKGEVVRGCADGRLVVADVLSGRNVREWKGHVGIVSCVAVSKDGSVIVSGSVDGEVKVWRALDGEHVVTLESHDQCISCLAVSGNGRRIVSVGEDGATIWDGESGEVMCIVNEYVRSVAIAEGGRFVFFGHNQRIQRTMLDKEDEICGVLGQRTRGIGEPLRDHSCAALSRRFTSEKCEEGGAIASMAKYMALLRNDEVLVTLGLVMTVRMWDTKTMAQIRSFEMGLGLFHCAAISEDEKLLVTGSVTGALQVGDVHRGNLICPQVQSNERITDLNFVDGRKVVSCSLDGAIKLWDLQKQRSPQERAERSGRVTCLAFFPCGTRVLSGSDSGTLQVRDTTSGQQIGEPLRANSSAVISVSVFADGKYAASEDQNRAIRFWDIRTFRGLGQLYGGNETVTEITSGNRENSYWNKYIRSSFMKQFARASGDSVHSSWTEPRLFALFIPDEGTRIISVSQRETVIWNLKTPRFERKITRNIAHFFPEHEMKALMGEVLNDVSVTRKVSSNERQIVITDTDEISSIAGTLEKVPSSFAVSSDGYWICIGFEDGSVASMAVEGQRQSAHDLSLRKLRI